MNTTENNKIIAGFMNIDKISSNVLRNAILNDLKYHLDWNWLMEVVIKIYNFELEEEEVLIIRDALADASMQGTYDACVEFIKWYNEQKSNQDEQ
jgi:hypothetical protein